MNAIVENLGKQYLDKELPQLNPGDTVKVFQKIVEGDKERIQTYEGVVIARKGHGIGETFTVRKKSFGVGVERVFPINSPVIESIEVIKKGRVRRAKLNFLREKVGQYRIKEEN